MPCNTFSTVPFEYYEKLLEDIYRHLSKSGIFAFSVPNPHILITKTPSDNPELETILHHPITKNPIQISHRIIQKRSSIIIIWYYDHLYPNGQVQRTEMRTRHNLVFVDQYSKKIQQAGFEIDQVLGDFTGNAFSKTLPYIIITARKI
jgi:hypothetical protein